MAKTQEKGVAPTMPQNEARDRKIAERNATIRELYFSGQHRQADLARRFKMTQGRVSQIVKNPNSVFYYENA